MKKAESEKGFWARKLIRLLKTRNVEQQETTILQENTVDLSRNIYYDFEKEIQTAWVEAERKKAEALMEMQKRHLIC